MFPEAGMDDEGWEMENGTKRNRIKSFATPAHSYEANQGHHQGRLAHRVRVGGVPNEATPASFSASPLGVNEANQGQMGPRFSPPSFPRVKPLAQPYPSTARTYERNERK